jgi:hypothetical protein
MPEEKEVKLNRYCNYCGAELVVKDIREPKVIGFDEFNGKQKFSHKEYFGVCPNRKKFFDSNHEAEWLFYDNYTRSYFYAGLYNYRDTITSPISPAISIGAIFIIVSIVLMLASK